MWGQWKIHKKVNIKDRVKEMHGIYDLDIIQDGLFSLSCVVAF